ncbi:MAG: hypothetical protein HDT50_02595 [Lactobacillus sp.]|nr:hypothetical protein [Lactobacillus sp.]
MNITDAITMNESPQVRLSYILDDIETLDRYANRVIKAKNEVKYRFNELDQLPPSEKPASIKGIYNLYDFRMELLTLGVPIHEVYKFDIKPEPELNVTIVATHKVMEMIYKHDEQAHRLNTMLETYRALRNDLIKDLACFIDDLKKFTPNDLRRHHLTNQQFLDIKNVSEQLAKDFKA